MENSRILEALKMAILMEKRGQSFYSQVARQTQSEEIRKIFETMANEEVIHEKFLSDHFMELSKNNKLSSVDLPKADAEGLINLVITDKIKKEINAASYEAAAISAAIDMESNAIKVYGDYAAKATDQAEKDLFNWLSNWERTHHKILIEMDKELKESIWNDNQFWPF